MEFPKETDILEQRVCNAGIEVANVDDHGYFNENTRTNVNTEYNEEDDRVRIRHTVNKFFPMIGWFSGEIGQINPYAESGKIHQIKFEGGNDYDWSLDELKNHDTEARVKIVYVGYRSVCQFLGGGVFSGRVVNIMQTNKWRCKFHEDNEKL